MCPTLDLSTYDMPAFGYLKCRHVDLLYPGVETGCQHFGSQHLTCRMQICRTMLLCVDLVLLGIQTARCELVKLRDLKSFLDRLTPAIGTQTFRSV